MANTKKIFSTISNDDKNLTNDIRTLYRESLTLVEQLHHRFLDVIKNEFERKSRNDINAVQALLLYNIGSSEVTAGELSSRGYYLGSNVSYNLKKLVVSGFIKHERSQNDKRSVRVSVTSKGAEIINIVDNLYDRHTSSIEHVGGINDKEFAFLNKVLSRLKRFWTDQILYQL